MESNTPAISNVGSLARTITNILRFRRNTINRSNRGDEVHKVKPSKSVEECPTILTEPSGNDNGKVEDKEATTASNNEEEAIEALVANLFTSVSAIKASYAQLQIAESPYDPETIQSSDQAVVSELTHLSELKQSYFNNQFAPLPPMVTQAQEHRNILKTYQITTKKLEEDFRAKDPEVLSLQTRLAESDRRNRFLDSRLHPGETLSCLDNLHLTGLGPTHFLAAVEFAVRAIRSFAKAVVREMESAGWDLCAAASSIQPDVHLRPDHRIFALESFVCEKMFSGFQDRNMGLPDLEFRSSWERKQFFTEFMESKSLKPKRFVSGPNAISPGLKKFCRGKYLSLVHPKMEASFFGDLEQRELISSGRGFPETQFFAGFAEMARTVWMVHNLFFSFGREVEGSIFRMRTGCLFSDVYMESVVENDDGFGLRPMVGFTVMPGFRVGETVIQCKVYVSGGMSVNLR